MTKMKYDGREPVTIIGHGRYVPGKEYPLADELAAELIAAENPDWTKVEKKGSRDENASAKKGGMNHADRNR